MSTTQSPNTRPNKRPRNQTRKPKPANPQVQQLSSAPNPSAVGITSGTSTPALNSYDTTPAATPRSTSPNGLSKTFSQTKFSDLIANGQISAATAVGIQQGGFINCTEVQAQTLPVAVTGVDL